MRNEYSCDIDEESLQDPYDLCEVLRRKLRPPRQQQLLHDETVTEGRRRVLIERQLKTERERLFSR